MNRYLLLGFVIASLGCENEPMTTAPNRPAPITGDYTYDEINTLLNLFFADREQGGAGQRALTKWRSPIFLILGDQIRAQNMTTLREVIDDINCAAGNELMRIGETGGNLSLELVPTSTIGPFAGYTHLNWNSFHQVMRGTVRIAQELSGQKRAAAIRHELMHSVGPLGHVQFGQSVLQGGSITWLTPLDETLIEMLYSAGIQPGMSREEAFEIFRELESPKRNCAEGAAE